MTTPIDTTRLRVLLAEASEPHDWSVATLAGCLRILDTDGGIVATVSEESDVRLIVAMREALPGLLDEVDRLRKIFDDAGQGEHNVLALVEHYQDCVSKSEDELASAAAALGEGWLINGATLAEGIERKTRALEGLGGVR